MLQGFFSDCRHAVRLFRRTPAQSLSALVVVAVGIAFSASFFSLYSAVALKPLPGITNPSALVSVGISDGKAFNPSGGPTRAMLSDISERSRTLSAVAGYIGTNERTVSIGEYTVDRRLVGVTPGFFRELGVRVFKGLPMDGSDHADGARVAVVSHAFWRERLNSDPDVSDRILTIDDNDYRIAGVTAPGFNGFSRGADEEIYLPLRTMVADVFQAPPALVDMMPLTAIGRRAGSTGVATADRELVELGNALREDYSDPLRGMTLEVVSHPARDPYVLRDGERSLAYFGLAAVLLVLIAAGNLGLFFLARVPGRRPELAIRQSVGARSGRIVRQLATESALLVFAGAALGLLVTAWLAVFLRDLPLFREIPWQAGAVIDWRVGLFTVAMALAVSLITAVAPLWSLGRETPVSLMTRRPGRPGRLQQGVSLFQVALAMVVLAVGLLFTQVTVVSSQRDLGFDPDGLTIIHPTVTADRFSPDLDAVEPFRRSVRERLHEMADVESVGFARDVPMDANGANRDQITIADGNREEIRSRMVSAEPQWLDTLGIRILRGRLERFEEPDTVAVSASFARAAWSDKVAIGKQVGIPEGGHAVTGVSDVNQHTVVAVADEVRIGHPAEADEPTLYRAGKGPLAIMAPIAVRSALAPEAIAEVLTPLLAEAQVAMEIERSVRLKDEIDHVLAPDRSRSLLTGAAAALVVALAAMGFFGTLRYMVEAGRFEFALRSAVGASPRQVFAHVCRRGAMIALPGLVVGVLFALLALDTTLRLFEMTLFSPWSAIVLALLLMAILLGAAIMLPARRAARMPPGPILRED